jgi:hypothetical protein
LELRAQHCAAGWPDSFRTPECVSIVTTYDGTERLGILVRFDRSSYGADAVRALGERVHSFRSST